MGLHLGIGVAGQTLVICGLFVLYVVLGFASPFVFGLGYIWVDLFTPQFVIPDQIHLLLLPVSATMALGAFATYFLFDRKDPPRANIFLFIMVFWSIWITYTTVRAVVPESAWWRWDYVFKSMIFTAFMPFLFRSRIQIESAFLTVVFACSGSIIAAALKTLITGGGYNRPLMLTAVNSGYLGDSSTFSTIACALVPIALVLAQHSVILPLAPRHRQWAVYGFIGVSIVAILGSFARAGLLTLAALAAMLWWDSNRKMTLAATFGICAMLLVPIVGPAWWDRMSTITNPEQEHSAAGRLWVWEWTWNFARANPLGGGFEIYLINNPVLTDPVTEEVQVLPPKAAHNMFFQVLGEHGFVGLAIYLMLIGYCLWTSWRLFRRTRGLEEFDWIRRLARASIQSILIFLLGGMFVNTAYAPFFYYVLGLSVCMSAYHRRVVAAEQAAQRLSRRARAVSLAGERRARPIAGLPRPAASSPSPGR